MVNQYAVMGNPVAHSLSPIIHQDFAKQVGKALIYTKIQVDTTDFEIQVWQFFSQGGQGLNITLPFKERAFIMADKTTARCLTAKSANTLWIENKQLWADNTDGIGLVRDLTRYINLVNKKVLILGAGGAARGIIDPLLQSHVAALTLVNRTEEKLIIVAHDFPDITTTTLEQLSPAFDLIINATSANFSQNKTVFLPESILKNRPLCYDLNYNLKKPTPFITFARAHGCVAYDGLGMLVEQAAEAFLIWHQFKPNTEAVLGLLKEFKDGISS